MPSFTSFVPLAVVLFLVGCDAGPEVVMLESTAEATLKGGFVASATGGGVFDAGIPVHFAFGAVQTDPEGSARGQLRFWTESQGLAIEFHGKVTCMTSDLEHGRAWIGGVITRNGSEHPAFTREIHEVGKDIWFRVVDYGEGDGAPQPDRTTFVGFEGGAGIITSPEYCETQPWPDGDARTGPVLEGNIRVGG